jgi:hypothetical protein
VAGRVRLLAGECFTRTCNGRCWEVGVQVTEGWAATSGSGSSIHWLIEG